jgi:MFS family permease
LLFSNINNNNDSSHNSSGSGGRVVSGYEHSAYPTEAPTAMFSMTHDSYNYRPGDAASMSSSDSIYDSIYSNAKDNESMETMKYISILYFGEMFGAVISFPFIDNFGRKYTLIASLIFCIFMILWTMLTSLVNHLFTSRFFMGMALGFMMTIAPIYIAEVSCFISHDNMGFHSSILSAVHTM